ncbi:hypothetical protein HMPREF3293_00657 [Christensenella minuta]|uniref:Uncharacterized protein n=1 Tax=Christensenella minuta TaxID=626937 RepID=A0A136Q758_9FIRM|nr:hypothetical protein HMPREF3293_00657 [Christensenella minuta]
MRRRPFFAPRRAAYAIHKFVTFPSNIVQTGFKNSSRSEIIINL